MGFNSGFKGLILMNGWLCIIVLPWLISNSMHKILIYLYIIHLLKPSTCFEHYEQYDVDHLKMSRVMLETYYLLTPWSRVLLEKLTGLQLVKKFPHFMEPEGSSPHTQAQATCPYPELAPSSPHTHPHPTSQRSILILSSHLRLVLPNGLLHREMHGEQNIKFESLIY